MIDRVIGVLKLDAGVFEEIEADQTATTQAAIIVLIVAVLSGIGSGLSALLGDGSFILSFFGAIINGFVIWLVWSAATFFVGTNLFDGQADLGEMLRVIGFAQAPFLLNVIPCMALITWIWALATTFIGIRQGLDLDNTKTLLTALVCLVLFWIVQWILGLIGLSAMAGFSAIGSVFG
jgi:hypothetical protein